MLVSFIRFVDRHPSHVPQRRRPCRRAGVLAAAGLLLGCGTSLVAQVPAAPEPPATQPATTQPAELPLPPAAVTRLGTSHWLAAGEVKDAALSSDGKLVFGANSSRGVVIWDAATALPVRHILQPNGGGASAVAPVGNDRVAAAWWVGRKAVTVHDRATGDELLRVHPAGTGGSTTYVAASPDGTLLATAASRIEVFDARTGDLLADLGPYHEHGNAHPNEYHRGLQFSGDGQRLLAHRPDGSFDVWDLARREPMDLQQIHGLPTHARAAALLADGRHLVVILGHPHEMAVRLFDLNDGVERATLLTPEQEALERARRENPTTRPASIRWLSAITTAAAAPRIAVGGNDGNVDFWDLDAENRPRYVRQITVGPGQLQLSDDGQTLLVRSLSTLPRLVSVATAQPRHPEPAHGRSISWVAASDDGAQIVTASGDAVARWDARTGKPLGRSTGGSIRLLPQPPATEHPGLRVLHGNPRLERPAAVEQPVRGITSGSGMGGPTTRPTMRPPTLPVTRPATRPTTRPATWPSILLHPSQRTRARPPQDLFPDVMTPFELDRSAISIDRSLLVVPDEQTHDMHVWDAQARKKLRTLRGTGHRVEGMAFPPDQSALLVSDGAHLRLWETADWSLGPIAQLNKQMPSASYPCFSPDGRYFAAGSQYGPALWDVAAVREGRPQPRWFAKAESGYAPVFSDQGQLLAVPDGKGVVVIEVATGRRVIRVGDHAGTVYPVMFVPGDRYVVSGGDDRVAYVWDLPSALTAAGLVDERSTDAQLLDRLDDPDPAAAYAAGVWLTRRGKLPPSPDVPNDPAITERARALVAQLAAEDKAVREQAHRELERIGPPAASAVQAALINAPEGERRDRLRSLARLLGGTPDADPNAPPSPRILRDLRLRQLHQWRTAAATQEVER